jgi:hypothetical protein
MDDRSRSGRHQGEGPALPSTIFTTRPFRRTDAKSAGECVKYGGVAEIGPLNSYFRSFRKRGIMGWKLELVRSPDFGPPERFTVSALGEIAVPVDLDGVGFDLVTFQRILFDLQRTVVTIQERALKAKAMLMRQADPTLSLKDYRPRSVQTLFGTLTLRVPRLVRHGSRLAPPCLLRSSARSSTEYGELRSRLGAFMSYRMAERIVGELFPFAVGRASSTARRQLLRRATGLATDRDCAEPDRPTATAIDLGIDTTFIRSNAAEGSRHHEVLIGVGTNGRGKTVKLGAVISACDKP